MHLRNSSNQRGSSTLKRREGMRLTETVKDGRISSAQESEELEIVIKVAAEKLLIKAVVLKETVIWDMKCQKEME